MKNINLKNYNSYKLKCIAQEFYMPKNLNELKEILNYIKINNLKFKIIGNGTNIIFKNNYYDGVIIKLNNFNNLSIENNIITVGSGYNLMKLCLVAAKNNLSGIEFAAGIPGTIGGSVFGNAGAYGESINDYVCEVTFLTPELQIKKINKFSYGYRTSYFKNHPEIIILEVKFKLKDKDKKAIDKFIKEKSILRKKTQPINFPNAGSVFKNSDGYSAGRLIDEANLKGKKIGGAKISEKHANFIINDGNATGENIIKLINEIQQCIKEKNNIDLVLEQEIIEWYL